MGVRTCCLTSQPPPRGTRPQAATFSVLICVVPLSSTTAPQPSHESKETDKFELHKTEAFARKDTRQAYDREVCVQGSFEYVVRVVSSRPAKFTLWNPVVNEVDLKKVADVQFLEEPDDRVLRSHNEAMTKAATQDSLAVVTQVQLKSNTGHITIAIRDDATTHISASDISHILRRRGIVPST